MMGMSNERLISVESQSEFDITSGKTETRIFVKMYVDAVHKGLIAELGPERWQTLCVLAAFMNAEGECFPSQDTIASALNVKRETANRRIKSLCDFKWNGANLVIKERVRTPGGEGFDNNRYRILPISQLAIFDNKS